jgi:GTP-binding protein Era
MSEPFHSGFAALVGRPNAGKSTLLNRLVGEKVAIVSDKPQTTRNRIRGVVTRPGGQIVLIDTPGVHKPGYALNRRMMQAVAEALLSVDLVVLLVDAASRPGAGDQFVDAMLAKAGKPLVVALNKVDRVRDKSRLLPRIEKLASDDRDVVPISALTGENVERLVEVMLGRLGPGPRYYPDDEYTDQPVRVLAAELVREKLLARTGEELPYVTAVLVERWDETERLVRTYCAVYVERESQKAIVIGRGGEVLKQVGTEARTELEHILGKKVYLELRAIVRSHWRNDERTLDHLGIEGKGRA